MSWRTPTEDDIIASLSVDELNAFKASANWEADPIQILLNRTIALFRDAIRSGGNVTMSPNASEVPEGVISPLIDYVVYDIVKRIGGAATDERKAARNDAAELCEKIMKGDWRPESYGSEEELANGGSNASVVKASRPRLTPEQLEGI